MLLPFELRGARVEIGPSAPWYDASDGGDIVLMLMLPAALAVDLTWLEGCWQAAEAPCREIWVTGQVHVGAGLCETEDPSWEHLWLGEVDGTLVYRAHPSGQEPTDFAATTVEEGRVVWENPEHDFPQRITYTRSETGYTAVVEAGQGDGRKGFTLTFTPCGSALEAAEVGEPPEVAEPPCLRADPQISKGLASAARADQKDRKKRLWEGLSQRDGMRLALVRSAVETQSICSVDDAWNAGVVLQHSHRSDDHGAAYGLFAWACKEGEELGCHWAPLAWDRHLVSAGRPQWFGTQFQFAHAEDGTNTSGCLVAIDPRATDTVRARFDRASLAEVVESLYTQLDRPVPEGASYEGLVEAGLICEPEAWE